MIKIKMTNFYYGFKCNLACKGCNSGSDIIFHKDHDPSLESILESITNFAKHVSDVTITITLIGGEPLLYWNEKIVPMAHHVRKYYPTTTINISTNGLLLHKLKDEVIQLLLDIDNIRLSVDDHTADFSDDPVGKKYLKNLNYFLSDPRLHKIHDEHYDIPNKNIDIMLHSFLSGFHAQFLTVDRKLKPFATNDPEGSMKYGCVGNICSAIIDSKLYKCPRLLSLPKILAEVNQLDDPDWAKYLNYAPVDLSRNDIEEELNLFEATEGLPIPECDVCANKFIQNITWFQQSKENVIKRK